MYAKLGLGSVVGLAYLKHTDINFTNQHFDTFEIWRDKTTGYFLSVVTDELREVKFIYKIRE